MHREENVMDLWLTCIIDSVPHLKTADGAAVVLGVTFKDQLKARAETHTCKKKTKKKQLKFYSCYIIDLPGLDLPPQVFKLLQVQLSSTVSLKHLMGKKSNSEVKPKMLFLKKCFPLLLSL